jgi:hypothetical protein
MEPFVLYITFYIRSISNKFSRYIWPLPFVGSKNVALIPSFHQSAFES